MLLSKLIPPLGGLKLLSQTLMETRILEGRMRSDRMARAQSGTDWHTLLLGYSTINTLISLRGLSGVPAPLQYLREEVGLAGPDWESLGAEWKTLAALWLRTEVLLSKSDRTDLSFDQIRLSSIPEAWKDWMSAKLMNVDANRPAEIFGTVFTDYLNKLPSSTMAIGGTVMTEIWCRPGKTGIIGLLLCLYWQAECSGAGNDWKMNITRVGYIFNAILGQPEL